MSKWTFSEDAYLAANFASTPMDEMIQATGRTIDAIRWHAKSLGLKRPNMARFKKGMRPEGKPFRPDGTPWNTTLRDAIITELAEHKERTVGQIRLATGASDQSIRKSFEGLEGRSCCHIARFEAVPNSPGNIRAVYRIGAGARAEKISRGKPGDGPDVSRELQRSVRQNASCDIPDPVPYVELPFWHQRVFSKEASNELGY